MARCFLVLAGRSHRRDHCDTLFCVSAGSATPSVVQSVLLEVAAGRKELFLAPEIGSEVAAGGCVSHDALGFVVVAWVLDFSTDGLPVLVSSQLRAPVVLDRQTDDFSRLMDCGSLHDPYLLVACR